MFLSVSTDTMFPVDISGPKEAEYLLVIPKYAEFTPATAEFSEISLSTVSLRPSSFLESTGSTSIFGFDKSAVRT